MGFVGADLLLGNLKVGRLQRCRCLFLMSVIFILMYSFMSNILQGLLSWLFVQSFIIIKWINWIFVEYTNSQ